MTMTVTTPESGSGHPTDEVTRLGTETEVQRLQRELAEAREQQAATNDLLQAIARGPVTLQPVLDAIVESAAKLCGADVVVHRLLKDRVVISAHAGSLQTRIGGTGSLGNMAGGGVVSVRAMVERRVIHVTDLWGRKAPSSP